MTMRCRRNGRSRRGVSTLESLLVIPILLIVLVFSIQAGIAAIYQAAVVHAATVAAREAGKGVDLDTVVAAVQYIVDVHGIAISDAPGSGTKVVVDGFGFDPPASYGDPTFGCPLPANETEDIEVRVTVCVDLAATRFCDALAPWGLSFAGRTFRASSLVMMELEQDQGLPGD
jgi:hypothetical protein